MQYISQEISNLYSLCKEKIFFALTHTHCAHCGFFFFHTYSLHTVIYSSFFTLHHWTKPPQILLDLCAFTKKKLSTKPKPFCISHCATYQAKIHFILLVSCPILLFFFLHPIGKDPWDKVIKFFIAQSTFNTSISIPWWTRTTILLWKGIGFSFTRRNRFFFFNVIGYPKMTKLIFLLQLGYLINFPSHI